MDIVKIDVSKNAREVIKKQKPLKGGMNVPAIVDDILIKAGLLNKDGSIKN